MAEYYLQFTSESANVSHARREIVDFARHWFSGSELADIESAVGEALANSAEHGAKRGGAVDVHCSFDGQALVVEVKDDGDGFERWSAVDYVQPLRDAARGYGIFIMRELMDEVEYTERGTRVRLCKRLVRPQVLQRSASDAG
jgi:anti-sigma regulatory factor (Ser/Thr protein kinase)